MSHKMLLSLRQKKSKQNKKVKQKSHITRNKMASSVDVAFAADSTTTTVAEDTTSYISETTVAVVEATEAAEVEVILNVMTRTVTQLNELSSAKLNKTVLNSCRSANKARHAELVVASSVAEEPVRLEPEVEFEMMLPKMMSECYFIN